MWILLVCSVRFISTWELNHFLLKKEKSCNLERMFFCTERIRIPRPAAIFLCAARWKILKLPDKYYLKHQTLIHLGSFYDPSSSLESMYIRNLMFALDVKKLTTSSLHSTASHKLTSLFLWSTVLRALICTNFI